MRPHHRHIITWHRRMTAGFCMTVRGLIPPVSVISCYGIGAQTVCNNFRTISSETSHTHGHVAPAAKKPSSIPPSMIKLLEGRRFGVAKVPGSGRGLVATSPLPLGTEVHREAPMVCYPSFASQHKVCNHCLKPLGSSKRLHRPSTHCNSATPQHCSVVCSDAAQRQYLGVAVNAPRLQHLHAACEQEGDRFPLIVSRIASAHLMAALDRWEDSSSSSSKDSTSSTTNSNTESAGSNSNSSSSNPKSFPSPFQAESISNAVTDLHFLCFANVPKPYPPAWVHYHELMNEGFRSLLTNPSFIVERGSGGGSDEKRVQALRALHDTIQVLDLDWFVSSLARLHINAFRVENPEAALAGVAKADWGAALQAALAQAISGREDGSSGNGSSSSSSSSSSGQTGNVLATESAAPHTDSSSSSSRHCSSTADGDSSGSSGSSSNSDDALNSNSECKDSDQATTGSNPSSESDGQVAMSSSEPSTDSSSSSSGSSSSAFGGGGTLGSAIYLMASMFNHSCDPNIEVSFPAGDATAVFTATRDVEAGEELCITYIDTTQALAGRQTALEYAYGFRCECPRCEEEAEAVRDKTKTYFTAA